MAGVSGEAKFALGMTLLQKLCTQTKENFVFSPLSLGTAFAMLTAGLKGETKQEVLTLLGISDEAELHKMYAELIANKDLPLKIANKYLADHRVEVQPTFDKLLKEKYESEVETVDFVKDGPKVEGEVNSWVAKKTGDMIKQLLSPGTLTPDTILVLLNAVYFKGTWVNEFDPIPTELDFTLRDGSKVKKAFMTKKSSDFKYLETDHLRMVKIPYKEAGCYMVVAIPKDETKHIDDILSTMSAAEMSSAVEKLNSSYGPKVILTMPKFKIDYKYDSLMSHMKALGVNKIFKAGEGDFGDLFSKPSLPVAVSDVVHKAIIEVDERGTKAAAATAVVMMFGSCFNPNPPPEIIFTVDRPFAFMLATVNLETLESLPAFKGVCRTPEWEG